MEDTSRFVEQVQETQRKAERSQRTSGHGAPAKQLPNKQHSTNK